MSVTMIIIIVLLSLTGLLILSFLVLKVLVNKGVVKSKGLVKLLKVKGKVRK